MAKPPYIASRKQLRFLEWCTITLTCDNNKCLVALSQIALVLMRSVMETDTVVLNEDESRKRETILYVRIVIYFDVYPYKVVCV